MAEVAEEQTPEDTLSRVAEDAQEQILRSGGNLLGVVYNAFDARRAARR